MNCPKCLGKLEEKITEDFKVDVCFVCEGIWFDADELKNVLEADAKDFKFIDLSRKEFDGEETKDFRDTFDKAEAVCPKCQDNVKLVKKEFQGKHKVNVDICPRCNGIWLDGGEINELRKRGLVDIKEKINANISLLQYIFSIKGIKAFFRKVFIK